MFIEVILLSVIFVTGYFAWVVMRRLPSGHRTYGWMLTANCLIGVVAFMQRREANLDSSLDLLSMVAIAAAFFMVFVPSILRDLTRRALIRDRLRLATFWVETREILQPGMGARQEIELIESIKAVRSGNVESAVASLVETRDTCSDALDRRYLDERIVMTYLYARRWSLAIEHFERHLIVFAHNISPQLLVEMVRAYCESEALVKAADLVNTIERTPWAKEPLLLSLISRSRLVFLAFVGRTTAVESLMAPTGPLAKMPAAAQKFWSGVSRMNAGDRSGAEQALKVAAQLSGRDRRARELAEETLLSLNNAGALGPRIVDQVVAQLADNITRLCDEMPAPKHAVPLVGLRWSEIPVTTGILLANLVAAAAVFVFGGSFGDGGFLFRAGSNAQWAVDAGEWWRLGASVFLHKGILHLLLNMYGLWILGKLTEQMYGSTRFFCVYMVAGLVGAGASHWFGVAVSVGASGAIFGLIGAAIAELWFHREDYPAKWGRALLGNLIFITAATVVIGFVYPQIDQAAHVGGLVGGVVMGFLFSPKVSIATSSFMRIAVIGTTIVCGASIGYAGISVATTSLADTLSKNGRVTRTTDNFRLEVPRGVIVDRFIVEDPKKPEVKQRFTRFTLYPMIVDFPLVVDVGEIPNVVDIFLKKVVAQIMRDEIPNQARLRSPSVGPLPSPWKSKEVQFTLKGFGGAEFYRMVIFAKQVDNSIWWGKFVVPEYLAKDSSAMVSWMLKSMRLRATNTP